VIRGQFDHGASATRSDGNIQGRNVELGVNSREAGAPPSSVVVHGLLIPREETGPNRELLAGHRRLSIQFDLDYVGIGAEREYSK
jgi:hypothetical protein